MMTQSMNLSPVTLKNCCSPGTCQCVSDKSTEKSLAPLSCVLREAKLFVMLDEGLL